jgi:hypothetical protein
MNGARGVSQPACHSGGGDGGGGGKRVPCAGAGAATKASVDVVVVVLLLPVMRSEGEQVQHFVPGPAAAAQKSAPPVLAHCPLL